MLVKVMSIVAPGRGFRSHPPPPGPTKPCLPEKHFTRARQLVAGQRAARFPVCLRPAVFPALRRESASPAKAPTSAVGSDATVGGVTPEEEQQLRALGDALAVVAG